MYVWRSERVEHSTTSIHRAAAPSLLESSIQKIASGSALHKGWENLQTGTKMSSAELIDKKMESRYEIFKRQTGDRSAAKRIDYH
jgi:hypothetical protein